MPRIRQFLALSAMTAVEVVRQPVILLLTGSCVALTALAPLFLLHDFGEEGKLARDGGLAFHFVFGLFVAGHAASSSLARELRAGTAAAILSKPVDRPTFFLAKFAGVAAVVVLFSACAVASTLLGDRVAERFVAGPDAVGYVTDWRTGWLLAAAPGAACALAAALNFARRRPFGTTAFGLMACGVLAVFLAAAFYDRLGRFGAPDFRVQWRLVPAGALVTLALLVLAAIALALSARLSAAPAMALCAGLFLAGLASDSVFGRGRGGMAAAALHRVLPNWRHFWMSDALTGGGAIPWPYVGAAALYALACAAAALCLGLLAFRNAETRG